MSVYVPNGREVAPSSTTASCLARDAARLARRATYTPDDPLVVLGDFNVAPEDRDVWDPKTFVGATHVTEPERKAVARLEEWGLEDVFRRVYPDADRLYSYWDYRAGDFHQHRGMRIDLVLATQPVAERVTWAVVDRNARKGTRPVRPRARDHRPRD